LDYTRVGNMPGSHFVNAFSALRCILNASSITKVPPLQYYFQIMEQVKISYSEVPRLWRMLRCCHIALC